MLFHDLVFNFSNLFCINYDLTLSHFSFCPQAAILQQTAEYIYNLEQEKTTLLAQNCQLKRLIEHDRNEGECTVSKKRKTESGEILFLG